MDVELRGIHKTFGAVHANDGINLRIPSGGIQGILGENGAGKSTLMKVLSGYIQADSGEILLGGKPTVIRAPSDAIHHGVGMLHQDPLDFPPLKALDNFLLGHKGRLFPNRARNRREFRKLAEEFDFSIDPEAYVDTLTVGERQQLEIVRLLWLGAEALILDEPTTGISAQQKTKLFAALKKLSAQGKTIIFVSHKLEDVEILCSQVAVLRQGRLIGEALPPYNVGRLVEQMFGKVLGLESVGLVFGKVTATEGPKASEPGAPALELQDLALDDERLEIRGVNLSLAAGQVIGLAGMEGSGQSRFLEACAGLVRPVAGKTLVAGREMTARSHHAFKRSGVAYLPAARLEEGLVPGLTLTEHFVLSEESHGLFVDRDQAAQVARERIKAFNIKGTPLSPVESLSGGNQQRALLALLRSPLRLVLLEHPTRGLDIESVIYIWSKLKERCQQGAAIVFISSDLDEILHYSDRVVVFFAGRVSPPLDAETLTIEQLGQLIGGKGWSAFGAPVGEGATARAVTAAVSEEADHV
jgi:general nucleoside transport system ATP-binding protein